MRRRSRVIRRRPDQTREAKLPQKPSRTRYEGAALYQARNVNYRSSVGHGRGSHHAALLDYNKFLQRRTAVQGIRHDVMLELYAGRGYLSELVYRDHARRLVLVDYNPKMLKEAEAHIQGVPVETYAMSNLRFIRKELTQYQGRLTFVDFDAYGCPGLLMQEFFKHYRVTRPMIITITDGMVYHCRLSGPVRWHRHYLSGPKQTVNTSPKDIDQIPSYNARLMLRLGKQHGFSVQNLGGWFNSKRTAYYGAFLINPSV